MHSSNHLNPIITISLVPPNDYTDFKRCVEVIEKDNAYMRFEGKMMPLYYPRWFPPKGSSNNSIKYMDIETPKITINYKVKDNNKNIDINSDIDIFLDDLKIGQITGDWNYSRPHAELFTLFGDNQYFVLRFWLYWVHKNFSKNLFLKIDDLSNKLRILQKMKKPDCK